MITYEEAGELLGLAAARDQRTVGDSDILAWHDDLNEAGITYEDARAALTRFYVAQGDLRAEDRFRATTPDVIHLAKALRRERLTNFVYEPPPGDTDPHYFARLRGQISATANGRVPALSAAPALEGGPHPQFVEELEARQYEVGRPVPKDQDEDDSTTAEVAKVRRPGPLGVECPSCNAPIGRPCKTRLRRPHGARRRVAAGRPAASEAPAEIEQRRAAALAHLSAAATTEDGQ
ncbi:zinc finger domain-containing protein [Streptomyces lydicamycinicus]|uniref:zinc finger domain-containing protein n=1 Tax=Streptomyces lydicamycinicus TaxID=1546107 RepID=UPI003C2DC410